jgi:cytidylate kinase
LNKYCVVVTGFPGSGKTTVGREVAKLLEIPFLDKDLFLEELFEEQGVGDSDWRRLLSLKSNDQFQKKAQLLDCAVLVSHWRPRNMPGLSGTPTEWLFGYFDKVIELYCECPLEVAVMRFKARKRHPGHLDSDRSFVETVKWMRQFDIYFPFMFENHIEVSTIEKVDLNYVIEKIRDISRVKS